MDNHDQLDTNLSAPLLTRVDRLDCLMKYIAGKASLWRGYSFSFGTKKKKECKPLYVAIEDDEAQMKETLLDRIQSLEGRLVQLALEIESRKSLSSTSASASTSSGGREPNYSYPTFNNPRRWQQQSSHLHQITIDETESNPERLQKKKNNNNKNKKKNEEASVRKEKNGNNKKRDEKKGKNGKKRTPSSWPHLRILGC